jgi:hypothetical protein
MQCFEEELMTLIDRFIGISPEVGFGPFETLTPVIE